MKAIVNAPPPKDRSEVRSFLGLAQFCAKFIPNFAAITSPLWDLTGDVEWKWTESEKNAFREVKSCLTRAPVMAYFTPGLPTRIVTDASPVGLSAILEQKQSDGEYRPVYYASRKLTDTKSRYSQFEREALRVYWACKRLGWSSKYSQTTNRWSPFWALSLSPHPQGSSAGFYSSSSIVTLLRIFRARRTGQIF